MEKELYHNRETFLALLGESADIKKKTMYLGLKKDVGCFLAYVEITGGKFRKKCTWYFRYDII